ncbi:IclR family transcriptional regulator [Nonomuraea fuscirosea]|jgi:DNA-binding IclR family transcriptional regulator|uniref:IclR family transcriptional regulator n=1 Tax=Nonomuraea fuscirosea TaxID=1291556 RepID=UPI002DDBD38C|nr:helix-turn-helix domain-containing protein [Nonomuraea fuscirosea]WSA55131.1 helix-turn-helix domain-containing protein [Nonomuraea fuscirosea]
MTDDEPSDLIRSVSRALRVLEEVSRADRPLSVKVIARRCGLNLSTSYHLVRTLCYEGYLHRRPDGDYMIGSKVAERFHEMLEAFERPPRAAEVLRQLAAESGHTAYLAQLTDARLVVVDVAEGPRSPWLEDLQAGLETAPHATALGKALLLSLPPRIRQGILTEYGLRRFTAATPTSVEDVEEELARLRPGQVVEEYGQFREEVACAGAVVPGTQWAIGISARGLSIPALARARLREALRDLT